MAEKPEVKRYALVANDSANGMRRFHLARVASARPASRADRLERMEEIAARERRTEGVPQDSGPYGA